MPFFAPGHATVIAWMMQQSVGFMCWPAFDRADQHQSQPDTKLGSPSVAAVPTMDPRISMLLGAMEAYEESIDSLRWKQRYYTPPGADHKSTEWHLGEASVRSVDTRWMWTHDSSFGVYSEPDYIVRYKERLYMGDGNFRLAFGFEDDQEVRQGLMAELDGFSSGGCHLWRTMGRCLDYDDFDRSRRPSELFRSAKELIYLEPTADEPWPGIRANNALVRVLADFEVRLDPEHGLAPRLFRSYKSDYGTLSETLLTIEYQVIDGIYIPKVGIQGTNYDMFGDDVDAGGKWLTDRRLRDFEHIESLAGLPEEARTRDVASWVKKLLAITIADPVTKRINGPLVCFHDGEAMVSPQIFVVSEVTLNHPSDETHIVKTPPDDAPVYDALIGTTTTWNGAYVRYIQTARRTAAATGATPNEGEK